MDVKALGLLEKIPTTGPTSLWTRAWLSRPLLEATNSEVIYEEGSLRLKIYRSHEKPARGQVLLFPSLINRPYVLDLGKGRSLISALVRSGLEVALWDWGSPGISEQDMGLKNLLEGRLQRSLHALFAHSEFNRDDSRPRTLLGHCLGGDMALLFAGQERKKSDGLRIDRLILLTTPIDTQNSALLNTWFQTPEWDPTLFARSFHTIPWPLLQMSFQLLRPTMTPKRWLDLARRLTEKDYRESWLQMEIWSNDNVSFSSELFCDLLIPLYRENSFLNADGKPLWQDVRAIDIPIFSIAAIDDHIVPLESVRALKQALPFSKLEVHELGGGHIGAVLSKKTREDVWPKLLRFAAAPC